MGTLASELGPRVDRVSSKPRIYVDANMPSGAVQFMRHRLDWDVLFVLEYDDLRRAADEAHYEMARRLHRTLITMDRDFLDQRRFPLVKSGGVIVLSAPNERGLDTELKRIDRAFFPRRGGRAAPRVGAQPPLLGQKIEVHPDWVPPNAPPTAKRRRRRRPKR